MRITGLLLASLAASLMPLAAQATGRPELPPELPSLMLPAAAPDDHARLPELPDLTSLFGGPTSGGQGASTAPALAVPLGPPSPLPPEGLPPGLKLGPPAGLPDNNPHTSPIPEPGTAVLLAVGLGLLSASRRRSACSD